MEFLCHAASRRQLGSSFLLAGLLPEIFRGDVFEAYRFRLQAYPIHHGHGELWGGAWIAKTPTVNLVVNCWRGQHVAEPEEH